MDNILVTRSSGLSKEADAEIVEAATVEVLRAAILAADHVLVPATSDVLPIAVVVVRSLMMRPTLDGEGSKAQEARSLSSKLGCFVPYAIPGETPPDMLQPFLNSYLGGSTREADVEETPYLEAVLDRFPPSTAVFLTPDGIVRDCLRFCERPPRILYFRALFDELYEPGVDFFRDTGDVLTALDEHWVYEPERDLESGRSDDDEIEPFVPFVPFGLLFQEALEIS